MNQTSNERPELEEKLAELEILRQSLEEAKAKEKDIYDQLLRLSADYQNFRKRSELQMSESRQRGREEVLLPLLSLGDALIQAETASQTASDMEALKKGLSLFRTQIEKFLSDQGLVVIPSKGEKLDPLRHEAIAQLESAEFEEGVIVEEIQRGYTLNNRVVRPARVRVSTKPKKLENMNVREEENHG